MFRIPALTAQQIPALTSKANSCLDSKSNSCLDYCASNSCLIFFFFSFVQKYTINGKITQRPMFWAKFSDPCVNPLRRDCWNFFPSRIFSYEQFSTTSFFGEYAALSPNRQCSQSFGCNVKILHIRTVFCLSSHHPLCGSLVSGHTTFLHGYACWQCVVTPYIVAVLNLWTHLWVRPSGGSPDPRVGPLVEERGRALPYVSCFSCLFFSL